jgi:hypothetical protein
MEDEMGQVKDAVCRESDALADMLREWQVPVEDLEGYMFTRGYLQGLLRALALMKGDRTWNQEDVSDWYALNIAGEAERRSEDDGSMEWVVRLHRM